MKTKLGIVHFKAAAPPIDDLIAAAEEVRKRTDGPIVVWGISMGAATAILGAGEGMVVDLIIAESCYDGFVETVSQV